MGWIALALLGAVAMAALVGLGIRRPLWSMIGSALMLGAAGYALQGRPTYASADVAPRATASMDGATIVDLRNRMLGQYSGDYPYMVAADAMTRVGEQRAAVQVILGGIRHVPESVMLWTGLGNALAAHDGNQLSPPALFAFRHALRLSPQHPAPPFFLGLAYIRGGQFAEARPYLRRALALTPMRASYRGDIEVRLQLLDQFLAASARPAQPAR